MRRTQRPLAALFFFAAAYVPSNLAHAQSAAAAPSASAPTSSGVAAPACRCAENPLERNGARVGIGLDLGGAILGGRGGASDGAFHVGASLRFGGAFTDRFHLLGEFTLGGLLGGPTTSFYGALDVQAQGFIGPNFYLRGGVGVAELVGFQGGSFYYTLPGPRLVGAIGYEVYRVGERSFAIEANTSYAFLNGGAQYNSLFLASVGAHFEFY